MFLVGKFLKRNRYRISNRELEAYMCREADRGQEKRPLFFGLLTTCYNDSRFNKEWRRSLYYGRKVMQCVIATPGLILFTHGICLAYNSTPPGAGFCLAFIGNAVLITWFGFKEWISQGWRPDDGVIFKLFTAFMLVFVFLVTSTFVSPQVWYEGEPVSLFNITAVFMTLNMMPMIWLCFVGDHKLIKTFQQLNRVVHKNSKLQAVREKFGGQSMGLAMGMEKAEHASRRTRHNAAAGGEEEGQRSKAFASLVGDAYSIDSRVEMFAFCDYLEQTFSGSPVNRSRRMRRIYVVALFVLALYALVAWFTADEEWRTLPFLLIAGTVVTDSMMYLLRRGPCTWGPARYVTMLFAGRAAITAFCGPWWLVGFGAAYFIWGLSIAIEIISQRMRTMTDEQAGAVAYFGDNLEKEPHHDTAGAPEFVLGYLSFIFLMMLVAAIFGTDEVLDEAAGGAGQKAGGAETIVPFLGQEWPVWVFGVLAFILVVVFAIGGMTKRSFFLKKMRMMDSKSYFFFKAFDLPVQLGMLLELFVVVSCILLYQITKSTFVLQLGVGGPIIVATGGMAYAQWCANDFWIFQKPQHREKKAAGDDEDEDDLGGGGGDLMGGAGGESPNPQSSRMGASDLGTISLPPLRKTGSALTKAIKMPSLPFRSPIKQDDVRAEEESAPLLGDAGQDWGQEIQAADAADLIPKAHAVSEEQQELSTFWVENFSLGGSHDEPKILTDTAAFFKGKLTRTDYVTFFLINLTLVEIFCLGQCIAYFEEPRWLGNFIWGSLVALIFILTPVKKYMNTYSVTIDMKISWFIGFVAYNAVTWLMFRDAVGLDLNSDYLLWIVLIYVGFPTFLLFVVTLQRWKDMDWKLTRFSRCVFAWVVFYLLNFLWVMFLWTGVYTGVLLSLIVMLGVLCVWFVHRWTLADFYLPKNYQRFGDSLLGSTATAFVAIGMVMDVSLFYCLSIAFFCVVVRLWAVAYSRFASLEPGSPLILSPAIFPVYSYSPRTHNVNNENYTIFALYGSFVTIAFWGILSTIFILPIDLGVGITAFILIAGAAVTVALVAYTPMRLGRATLCVDESMLKLSGRGAVDVFKKRKENFVIKNKEWDAKAEEERRIQAQLDKYAVKKEVKAEETEEAHKTTFELAEPILSNEATMWYDSAENFKKGIFRKDAPYALHREGWADVCKEGDGPLAFLALMGGPYKLYAKYFVDPNKGKYDEDGNPKPEEPDPPPLDSLPFLTSLPTQNMKMDKEYFEETRMCLHFQALVIVASQARLTSEGVLFQRFLRENRFKLLANGINPPSDIFQSRSFASVNVQVVAQWLLRLTPEQRERFQQLKQRFSNELEDREIMRDIEDAGMRSDAENYLQWLNQHDEKMCQARYEVFQARRIRRSSQGIGPADLQDPEHIHNVKEQLSEIEGGWSCQPGTFGRTNQFVDPEFPPEERSLGNCAALNSGMIHGWQTAQGLNMNCGLFAAGTDPDDVFQGTLHDGWFLSAVSILAASGGVGDNEVDELVGNLFINKASDVSETGAYAVQFYKNSQWETVVVDDWFPVLAPEYKATKCAGAAFAHSKDFEELWVPVLEKAYAKYYGSYAALENGYVQHALTALTGAESEEIFLAREARGSNKMRLWAKIVRFKRNGYLLGCGTINNDSGDNELLDSGLIFGSVYTVYEVRYIDGHRLLKLKNPPGASLDAEWKGDWGDKSECWTIRLKNLLDWSDEDDGCFWMSFDDFCLAFRSLYVCKYYNPTKWKTVTVDGKWETNGEAGSTAVGLPHQYNETCDCENNPQWAFVVDQPTDVCIKMAQTEGGLAHGPAHPNSCFVCTGPDPKKATRVTGLTNANVVAWSGDPLRKREVFIYTSLPARTYTILCGAYMPDMEGPFTLSVTANYPVKLQQLWPPPWKDDEPTSLAGKVKKAARQKAMKLAKQASQKVLDKTGVDLEGMAADTLASAKAGLEDNAGDGDVSFEGGVGKKKKKKEPAIKEENPDNAPKNWVEQYDPNSGKNYYYNTVTGISTYDKPPGFVPGGHDEESDAALKIQAQFRGNKSRKKKKKKKKKKPKGPTCQLCGNTKDEGRDGPEELQTCSAGCGMKVHPGCLGFSSGPDKPLDKLKNRKPMPQGWKCAICDVDGEFS